MMKLFFIFLVTSCFAVPRRNSARTENPRITTDNETAVVDRMDKKSRIINGSPVLDASSFPSYASIRRFGHNHVCGGVILDHQRILTATHCYISILTDTVIVGGIKRDGSDMQQERRIKTVWNHPDYIPGPENDILENDITVLELENALNFSLSSVQPIQIGSQEEFREIKNGTSDCQIIGHGYTDGRRSVVDQLQATKQIYINKKCPNYRNDSGHCFLTQGKASDSQACQGDSGGPLYCDVGNVKKLFGIVSFTSTKSCDNGLTGLTAPMMYTSFINGCPSLKLHLILAFLFISTLI